MRARLALQLVGRIGSRVIAPLPEGAGPAAFKRAIGRQSARVRNGGRRLFSAAGIDTPRGSPRGDRGLPALHREAK
jgi:hypothetical protein